MAVRDWSRKQWKTFLGVAILVAVTSLGWFLWHNNSAEVFLPELIENLPQNVDLGLDRVHYSHNENGKKSWSLDAAKAAYQREAEELALTDVDLIFYDAGYFGKLHLTADTGFLRQKQEIIDIRGHVIIRAETGEEFQSDSLRYDFSRRIITTRDPVYMQGKQLELRGVGMRLDVTRGTMHLLEKVYALLDEYSFQGETQ